MDRSRLVLVLAAVIGLLGLSVVGLINAASAAGTASIAGTVWGSNGPEPGVLVSATKNFQSQSIATTDALGHYTLTGLVAGSYGVQFTPPAGSGLAKKTYKTNVTAVANTTVSRIDGWLDAAGRIEGVATGPDGTYGRDVSVCTYRTSDSYEPPPVTTTTTLVGTSTTSTVATSSTSSTAATSSTTTSTTMPGSTTTSPPATTVVGTSISGTTIVDPDNDMSTCTRTDGAGRYTIDRLRPGTYMLSFQPPQGSGFGSAYFDNDAVSRASLVVPVAPGAIVAGVNVVLKPGSGNCTELSEDCPQQWTGCGYAQLIAPRTVRFQYYCGGTAASWHASDGQDASGNPATLMFATDGPFTVDGDITVMTTGTSVIVPTTASSTTASSPPPAPTTVVHVAFTFRFRAPLPPPTLPGAPRDVRAWPGVEQATIAWVKPADDGGGPATQYLVTATPGGATCTWTVGPRSCTITGLTAGTPYTFAVKATNGAGTGPSSPSSAPVTPLAPRFLDVPTSHPFSKPINWLAAEKITNGFPDGTYRGSEGVQRQAMAAFLYRLAGSPNGATPSCASAPFTDVGVGAAFCGEIAWLKGTGITTGSPDGTFRPRDSVSRGAMAAFLYRFVGSPNGAAPTCTVAPFSDVPVGAPFCGEITWLKGTGITTGFTDGTYRSTTSVSREAMAAFLFRLPR